MFAYLDLLPLGPPPTSSDNSVVPMEPHPPASRTPAKCDPTLSFDAVSTLRGEILFFKDRSEQKLILFISGLVYSAQKESQTET